MDHKIKITYWSLPIEFQYYIIFPVIIMSLRYLFIAGPILIAAALCALLQTEYRVLIANSRTLMLAYTFCGGVLIGYVFDRYHSKFMFKVRTTLALFASMMVILSYLNHYHYTLPEYIKEFPIIGMRMNMMGVVAIALVFVMLFTNFDHLIKSKLSRSLEFLGKIS
jgi:peptidoglycan/LPS O-acetylase OafA/YrhL